MPLLNALRRTPLLGRLFARTRARLADHEAERVARHFSAVLQPRYAASDAEREAVFALRHGVYCEELGFEPRREEGRERDAFDERALHAYLRHAGSGALVGTVRVVYAAQRDDLLPMEQHCAAALATASPRPSSFPRDSVCEISRLAVPAGFRRRASDRHAGAAQGVIDRRLFSASELRCFPWIAIALYFSAAALVQLSGRRHAFVMVEPRLAHSMSFVGIAFRQVGPTVDYHGQRAPYYLDGSTLRGGLAPGFRHLLDVVEAAIESQAPPSPVADAPSTRPC